MNRDGHEQVEFFIGTEVEQSPAFGKKTLFVVGIQSPARVIDLAKTMQCAHVYFGANQSFAKIETNDAEQWKLWEDMITPVLQQGYLCTLDLDVYCVEGLAESGLTEYNNFIPMISVKLPYIQLLGYNATIKLDDKDFRATNPGVWCHSLHDLRSRDAFTDWSKYTQDQVIAKDAT
jgi:hypothetical protein